MVFDDVHVPVENVVGKEEGGADVLKKGLDFERMLLSAGALGIMQEAFDISLDYANTRK